MSHYLFRFNQAAEDRVRRNAKRYGIEVIAPRVTTWRKCKNTRKVRPASAPAFHSYLILGFEPDQLFVALTKLHRSVRPLVVPFDGENWTLARVPDREIEAIRDNRLFKASSASSLVSEVVPDPKYAKSELVRILGGAATGLEGRIISANPKAREAEIEIDGWGVKLKADYDLLERAA
jgi:transcription antitermination factor NusG